MSLFAVYFIVRDVQRRGAAAGRQSAMVRRALACALLLSCLCRVHGQDNDGPKKNDTTWTRAVICGIVLVVIVMMMVGGVLVMAAKEEDGRALTKLLAKSSADGKSAGQDDASQGSQAEPRPASPKAHVSSSSS